MDALLSVFQDFDCDKVIFKRLTPNDNSKNQPYFGSHLTDLSFLPIGQVEASDSTSPKKPSRNRGPKFTARFPFSWIDSAGTEYPAPNSKLIYYPQYPEIRLSGFLQGCPINADGWMDPTKQGRSKGRVLVLGISSSKRTTFGFFAAPDSRIAKEIQKQSSAKLTNIFEVVYDGRRFEEEKTARERLLETLAKIHLKGWIPSQRMNADKAIIPYTAQNGGGYTLEAELGITPNGLAQPDYLGWEVKQFQVSNFLKAFLGKPLTLLTPEPTGGYYVEKGVPAFIRRYGKPSKKMPDRYNFCGRHFATETCNTTGLRLAVAGFDSISRQVSDSRGAICLIDAQENTAASWDFTKIIEHWTCKHANAVYVPSLKKKDVSPVQYKYSNLVRLYSSTNINLFLHSLAVGAVYYDPGIKLEHASTNPKTKRRSQFRVKAKELDTLYENREDVDLVNYESG
ncbi:MAG: hypothetical protein GY835_07955 [bacterium]|nr:hypothetical protein [bacterium]